MGDHDEGFEGRGRERTGIQRVSAAEAKLGNEGKRRGEGGKVFVVLGYDGGLYTPVPQIIT